MKEMTGGEAVVQSLIRLGIDTVFGLPGVQNDYLFNALYDNRDKIRFIHTRHEQGAAYMAMGYALATDKPAVYCVVPGPGVLNTTAALSTAYAVNAKVLCLTGQIPSGDIGKKIGLLHEIPDQLGVIQRLTKWAARVDSPSEVPAAMTEAFSKLLSGRPQPVGLEIPPDILAGKGMVDLSQVEPAQTMPEAHPQSIEAASSLLRQARNPMIFVGGGAQHAGEEVQELAEMLQAPIIPGRNGRGVVSNDHYLSLTGPGGYELWPDCDVALAVGSRMYIPLARWGFDDRLKIIRLDVDSDNLDNIAPTEVAVIGDSKQSLRQLLSVLSRTMTPRPSRKAEMKAHRAKMDTVYQSLQPQYDFVQAIRAALPDDGIFIDEVTQIGFVARIAMPVHHPRSYLSTGYQGTLGFGFPTALGVKVAFPDRPVLNVSGDGGFMYNVQELSTAVCHNIALVTVVFADNAFGNVKRMQQRRYGGREIASDLHNPDFVRLAESFGVAAVRVHTPSELAKAIRQGFEQHGPTLIEVPVGEMPSPWEITYPSANRGT